ncbi:MAG: squalene/phytoene synthase family protein [Pseudomonadota bacterium]
MQSDIDSLLLDEDFALVLPYLPSDDERRRAAAVFSLFQELRKVVLTAKEPTIASIRLKWWWDRIEEIYSGGTAPIGHPTLQSLENNKVITKAAMEIIIHGIDAYATFLETSTETSRTPAVSELRDANRVLLLATTDISAWENDALLTRLSIYDAARWTIDQTPRAIQTHQKEHLTGELSSAPKINLGNKSLSFAFSFVALARGYLVHGADPWPLRKRLTLFRAVALGRA